VPKAKVKKIGTSKVTGTKTTFLPDKQIFSVMDFNEKRILEHLRQQAYLTRGVHLNVLDKRKTPSDFYGFYFEGGLKSFVKYLADDYEPLQEEVFHVVKEQDGMDIEVAFTYVNEIDTKELSFANNIYTPDGGMHLTGFRAEHSLE
jgi:DNA gyrase subunit B